MSGKKAIVLLEIALIEISAIWAVALILARAQQTAFVGGIIMLIFFFAGISAATLWECSKPPEGT